MWEGLEAIPAIIGWGEGGHQMKINPHSVKDMPTPDLRQQIILMFDKTNYKNTDVSVYHKERRPFNLQTCRR